MKPNVRHQRSLPPLKRVQNAPNRARPHDAHLQARRSPPLPAKGIPDLELYQNEEDPLSHAVRVKLSDLGLDYVAHTVQDGQPLKHEKLLQMGGKDQIPFLMDRRTGVQLYNSDAIVLYLESEYGEAISSPVIQLARKLDVRVRTRADRLAWRVRKPLEQIARLGAQIRSPQKRAELRGVWHDSYETLRGTYRALRKAVDKVIPAKPVRGPRETRAQ